MFNRDIKRTIGTVLKANNYKLGPSLGEGSVYYIKRYSEKLGFYIGCRDNRPFDGPITIDMYFTGITIPDDGLMDLFAGIHVKIFEVYDKDVTDALVIAAGEKIVAIEKHIANTAETVLNELMYPFFIKKKYPIIKTLVYSETLYVYDTLKNDETTKDAFTLLEKICYKAFREKENKKAFDLCDEFFNNLPSDYFMKREVYLEDIKQFLTSHIFDYIAAQHIFGHSKRQNIRKDDNVFSSSNASSSFKKTEKKKEQIMFDENVKRTIGTVLKANKYKAAPYFNEKCICYIKRYSEELGLYIVCCDRRQDNGSITVNMYFTGIMIPDDRLIDSFAGIQIEIIEVYDKDRIGKLITAAGEKIVAIEKHLANAAETVLDELRNPFFIEKGFVATKELLVYSETLCIYDTLKKDEMIKDVFALLKRNCYEAFKKKENKKGVALCEDFLKNLPSDYFMKKEGCQLKGISASSLGLPLEYLMKKEVWQKNIENYLAASLFDYINAQAVFH